MFVWMQKNTLNIFTRARTCSLSIGYSVLTEYTWKCFKTNLFHHRECSKIVRTSNQKFFEMRKFQTICFPLSIFSLWFFPLKICSFLCVCRNPHTLDRPLGVYTLIVYKCIKSLDSKLKQYWWTNSRSIRPTIGLLKNLSTLLVYSMHIIIVLLCLMDVVQWTLSMDICVVHIVYQYNTRHSIVVRKLVFELSW